MKLRFTVEQVIEIDEGAGLEESQYPEAKDRRALMVHVFNGKPKPMIPASAVRVGDELHYTDPDENEVSHGVVTKIERVDP